jgi:hypothetical protein
MNDDTVAHECAHLLKFLLRLSKRNGKGFHLPSVFERQTFDSLQVSLSVPLPPYSMTTNASKRWSR